MAPGYALLRYRLIRVRQSGSTRVLCVLEEIQYRRPTTDTYSLPQSQEEFYFSLPYDAMDLCLFGKHNSVPVEDIAAATGLTSEQVHRVFRDIDQKRRTTQ